MRKPKRYLQHNGHTDSRRDTAAMYSTRGNCSTGKRSYPTKKAAKSEDRRRNRLGHRYYRCAECGMIHSTTMAYMEQVAHGLIEGDA